MDFRLGERLTKYAIMVTVLLAILKVAVGIVTNASVLVADGIHSFSDVLLLLPTLIALKLMQKKPTERFPFGYYKAENIATLIISMIILLFSVELFLDGIRSVMNPEKIELPLVGIIISIISILATLFVAKKEMEMARKLRSQSLLMNAKESYLDILLSAIVILSIALNQFFPVEGIGTIIIAGFVVKLALEGARESILVLMDAWNEPALIEKLKNELRKVGIVEEIKLRKAGPVVFGIVRIGVEREKRISQIEEIKRTARKIGEKHGVELLVIVEKVKKEKVRVCIPVENGKVSEHFGRTKELMIFVLKGNKIISKRKVRNPYADKPVRAGAALAEMLKSKVDVVIAKSIGTISYHILADAGVEIFKGSGKIEKVVKEYLEGRLERLKKPTKKKL